MNDYDDESWVNCQLVSYNHREMQKNVKLMQQPFIFLVETPSKCLRSITCFITLLIELSLGK